MANRTVFDSRRIGFCCSNDHRRFVYLFHQFFQLLRNQQLYHQMDIWTSDWGDFCWCCRNRILPADGQQGLVPFWLSAGSISGISSALQIAIPHYNQWWPVYFLRELFHLLRNGYRRAMVCPAWAEYCAVILCGMWGLCGGLSERGFGFGEWA